jgi:hypothetical protein
MPSLKWWRGARHRQDQDHEHDRTGPAATETETRTGDPMTVGTDDRQIDRLLDLAAKGVTGALHLNGRRGGIVYLLRGEVAHVESALTPGVAALLLRPEYSEEAWARVIPSLRKGETDDVATAAAELLRTVVGPAHAEVLRRGAMADAALAAFGIPAPEAARTRPRFRPGERHWCPVGRTVSVAALLAEVNRRGAVLARLAPGVAPGLPVDRSPRLWFDPVRLTASQWDVVRLADGARTPQDIAWLLGHGVFATTVAVHQLARLGVVAVTDRHTPPGAAPPRVPLSFLRAVLEPAS